MANHSSGYGNDYGGGYEGDTKRQNTTSSGSAIDYFSGSSKHRQDHQEDRPTTSRRPTTTHHSENSNKHSEKNDTRVTYSDRNDTRRSSSSRYDDSERFHYRSKEENHDDRRDRYSKYGSDARVISEPTNTGRRSQATFSSSKSNEYFTSGPSR